MKRELEERRYQRVKNWRMQYKGIKVDLEARLLGRAGNARFKILRNYYNIQNSNTWKMK